MPFSLSRKQSLWIGLGLLLAFFVVSVALISSQRSGRSNAFSSGLVKEKIEGTESSAPAGTTPSTTSTEKSNDPSSFFLNEFHRSLVRDGKTIWEVFGKRARYAPTRGEAEVESPRLSLTSKSGELVEVSAQRAILSLRGEDLAQAELFDDVVLRYKDETTLRTAHAIYSKEKGTVTVPSRVEITHPMMILSADRLEAQIESREFELIGNVQSTIQPKKVD